MSGILPLQFRPTPNVGTVYDPSVQVTNAQQLLQFKQQQDQVERQNALMGIFRDPKSLDGTGNPTPDTLQKIGAIDPPMMMKIRENMMIGQERQLRTQALSSDMMAKKMGMIAEGAAPIMETYEQEIKDGVPADQAKRNGQASLVQLNDRFGKSGVFNEDDIRRFPTEFDPIQMRNVVAGSKQYQEHLKQMREDKKETRQEQHQEAQDAAGQWHAGLGPDAKGNQVGGMWFTPKSGGEPQFHPGVTVTPPGGGSPAAAKQRDDATIAETEQLQAKGEPVPPEKQKAYDDAVARRKAGYDRAAGTAAAKAAPGSAVAEKTARFNEMKTAQQQAGTYKDDTTVYRALDKQMAEDKQTAISDDAALIAAQVALKTGHPPAWMGRSQASLTKFLDTYAKEAKRQNLSADDIAANIAKFSGEMAEARTLGTSSARIDFAAKELDVALPTALEASERVWRPGFKKLAEVQQAIKGQTSDPDLLEFAQFNQQVMSAYSAAMQRGGASTVHAMERAESLLSTATSQAGYMRQLDTLHKEVQTILYGTQAAKDHLRAEITGSPEITNPPVLTGVPRRGATNQPWKAGEPIPAAAIDELKKDPGSAAHFDEFFGKGEAAKALGPAKSETKSTAPSARPMAMPAKAADAIDGQVYETTRGPAKWDSKQQKFMPVGGP